jgi:hypothetical protein
MPSCGRFGVVARAFGVVLVTYIGAAACARCVPNQPKVIARNDAEFPQRNGPARDAGTVAALAADVGTADIALQPKPIVAVSPDTEIGALQARILNPYDEKATVSSPPPTHHITANFEEDLSMDLVNMAGSVGREVWFKAEALAPATAVRGRVLRGGKNALQPICSKWAHGGGGLQVGIEVLHNGTWKSVGWVLYGHVQDMTVDDGDVLESPTGIAKVTGLHDNNYCSTGGHLHLGFSDTTHNPCWAVTRRVPTDSPIAQVGGNRESLSKCSM